MLVLEAADPDAPPRSLAGLSIGERNARLLALRSAIVGPTMRIIVTCPICGEPLEFDQEVDDLLDDYTPPREREFDIVAGDGAAKLRLLTTDDLAAASSGDMPRDTLTGRAIRQARWRGAAVPAADLPADLISIGATQLSQRDPLAHIQIPLQCAACGNVWRASLEIASFLWQELDAIAKQLLNDVVALAGAYGWSEASILGMSPVRRRYYLAAIG